MKKLFCVYDSQTTMFGPPILGINKGDVIRQFTVLVNDGQSQFSKHPMDFALFEIGDYDESTGSIAPVAVPVRIITANELLSKA